MARFVCPNCAHTTLLFPTSTGGAEQMCKDSNLELLAQLPLEPALAKALDNGEDFFETNPDSTLAKSFLDLAEKVKAKLV